MAWNPSEVLGLATTEKREIYREQVKCHVINASSFTEAGNCLGKDDLSMEMLIPKERHKENGSITIAHLKECSSGPLPR